MNQARMFNGSYPNNIFEDDKRNIIIDYSRIPDVISCNCCFFNLFQPLESPGWKHFQFCYSRCILASSFQKTKTIRDLEAQPISPSCGRATWRVLLFQGAMCLLHFINIFIYTYIYILFVENTNTFINIAKMNEYCIRISCKNTIYYANILYIYCMNST